MVDGGRLPLHFALITFIIAFGARWATKSNLPIGFFLGVDSFIAGPILEGPPAQKVREKWPILATPRFGRPGQRRDFPFRLYLHARIPRITAVEQLPQIILILIQNPFKGGL